MRSARRTEFLLGLAGTTMALVGLGLSTYLTVAHYTDPKRLACSDKGAVNCLKVTTSSYAVQHGIPLVLFGLAFFVVTLALQLPPVWTRGGRLLRGARLAVAGIGAASVVWLVWVELFRLDAICVYCTGVHVLTVALFALTGIGTAATAPLE
ncbi:MAG: vitamin K epoxide reductase family protein [Acidimicrobiales bacterium]